MNTRTSHPVNHMKVIPIRPSTPAPQEYSLLTRVLLAVILAILFVAFMVTTPPMGAPEPCPPPQNGLWPECR